MVKRLIIALLLSTIVKSYSKAHYYEISIIMIEFLLYTHVNQIDKSLFSSFYFIIF